MSDVTKKTKMPKDTNQRAAATVARATAEPDEPEIIETVSVRLKWIPEEHTLDFREPLTAGHVVN